MVPPSGVIALVEFSTPLAASQAIKSLAYRKVGNSLIYTEHAPTDLWKTDSPAIDHKAMKLAETSARGRLRSGKASDEPEMSNSLYVTGLPPQTNAATFKSLFQGLTGFSHARLHAQPLYGERGRGSMSGFVGFSTPDDAQQARQVLHGHVLDGHIISVVKARSRTINTGSAEAPGSAKMVIKNLPFEADRHELKRLLSYAFSLSYALLGHADMRPSRAYGTIRSLRMPVNAQSRTRGFAFVQFDTPQEAAAARSGLSFTHLLGRHLIIEEAQ